MLDEVDEKRKNSDPIDNIKEILLNTGIKEEELKAVDAEVKLTINEAAKFAQESPEPSIDELFKDITIN